MMKVFEVMPDLKYRGFYPWAEDDKLPFIIDGTPRLLNWQPLPLRWDQPKKRHANFESANCGTETYGVDARAYEVLQPILISCCEFLPLQSNDGETHHLLNPLIFADCVDEEKSERRSVTHYAKFGLRSPVIERYCFIPTLVPSVPVFLMHYHAGLFTATGVGSQELEFKTIVEREKLTGLKFKLLWSNES